MRVRRANSVKPLIAAGLTAATVIAVGFSGCSGAPAGTGRASTITTTSPAGSSPATTASPDSTAVVVDAAGGEGLGAPGATLPQVSGKSTGPFDSGRLVASTGPAVAAVVARACDGGVVPSTAFAIDDHHLVTASTSLADDGHDPTKGIDPRPWLHLGDGSWVRGTVIGAWPAPNLAVIEVDRAIEGSLGWSEARPKQDEWGAVVGYAARSDNGSELLATKVTGTVGGPDLPMVTVTGAAAGLAGPGHVGAPLVDDQGRIQGMVVLPDPKGDSMVVQEATVMRALAEEFVAKPVDPKPVCDADAPTRLGLGWGLLLERHGSDTEVTQLGGRDALTKYGRVGLVDASMPSFVSGGASVAVALGPFGSEAQAKLAQPAVRQTLAKLDLDGEAELMLVPWSTFPDVRPAPPTTIRVAPAATAPPKTAAPPKTKTTTDERASTSDCSGPTSVRIISGAPAGYSYKMRSAPSAGASADAMGANGRQVSVVNGSERNGFVLIALPDGRCLWGSSQFLG